MIAEALWRVLISVKLTITLLVSLALFAALGTVIAQQGTTQVPIEHLYSAQVLKILAGAGLTDLYHSAIFVSLLTLLAINLISCSIERLPRVWREAFHVPAPPITNPAMTEWSPEEARKRKYLIARYNPPTPSVKEAKMATLLFFQKYFKQATVLRDREDQFQIMVEHGKYSRLGVYITHLSLLCIFFGGALGAMFGLEGGMSIEEGTRQSWIQHIKGSKGGLELMRENGVPVPNVLNLGFEVECEKFALETYDGERPKAFRSRLNFYENDVKVYSTDITVNHPTVYKGITFYQASFNELGIGAVDIKVFRMARRGPASTALKPPSLLSDGKMPKVEGVELVEGIRPGDLYRVDGDAAFKVLQIEANLLELGPAARIQFFRTKNTVKPEEFWVFKNLPGFDFAHRKSSPLHFVFEATRPKYATGLSVARDPGVWVVWAGSAILVLALFLALYTCHSRYWVAFTQEHGFVAVGWSNKLFLYEPRFEKFNAAFRKELGL